LGLLRAKWRSLFLPLFRFLGFCGQNGGLFFTAISFFKLLRAEKRSLFYRYLIFWVLAGRMEVPFLPLFRFLGFCEQNGGLFFTAISFFGLLRAEWGSLFYRYFVFWAFAGRMGVSFLPLFRFWGF
jgi:hypothetical protein